MRVITNGDDRSYDIEDLAVQINPNRHRNYRLGKQSCSEGFKSTQTYGLFKKQSKHGVTQIL